VTTFFRQQDDHRFTRDDVFQATGQSSRSSKSFSQNKKLLLEARNRDLSKLHKMMETRKQLDRMKNKVADDEEEEEGARPCRDSYFVVNRLNTYLSYFASGLRRYISPRALQASRSFID